MDKFYVLSSTKKVKNLETELIKELKDLKEEIEDADALFTPGSKSFRQVNKRAYKPLQFKQFKKYLKINCVSQVSLHYLSYLMTKHNFQKYVINSFYNQQWTKSGQFIAIWNLFPTMFFYLFRISGFF